MFKRPPKQAALVAVIVMFLLVVARLALEEAQTTVYFAKDTIEARQVVVKEMLVARSVRVSEAGAGAVRSLDEVQGKIAKTTIYGGLPVPRAALSDAQTGRMLPSGQSLEVDEIIFPVIYDAKHGPVTALLAAGDRVDLLWLAGEPPSVRSVFTSVRIGYILPSDAPTLYLVLRRDQEAEMAYLVSNGQLFIVPVSSELEPLSPPLIFTPNIPSRAAPTAPPLSTPRPATPTTPPAAPLTTPRPAATGGTP